MGRLNLINTTSNDTVDADSSIADRTKEFLINPEEQVKESVENAGLNISDSYQRISDKAPEISIDTSGNDTNLADAGQTLADLTNLTNPLGQMTFLAENLSGNNQGLNDPDVQDKLVDNTPDAINDNVLKPIGETGQKIKDGIDKTVDNTVPDGFGGDIRKAVYAVVILATVGVGIYVLTLLQPVLNIIAGIFGDE